MNPEQRDEIIDSYCDWFVNNSSRKVLEMMAWDILHEELHNLSTPDLVVAIETDCPELLETWPG
jgi:hypothetical protein